MSELTMNHLRLREDTQPAYPLMRLPAALQEWGSQMALELAKVGCASALRLYGTDLMALPDPQRILCEKVYGTLLSARGPHDVSRTVAPGTPPLGPPWGLTVRPQVGTGWAGVSAPGGDIYVHM